MNYTAEQLAFIIPTKDRPEKVVTLLQSLAAQTRQCHKIIVVASGTNIKKQVLSFKDQLPVEYHHCDKPGQIHQRNRGIQLIGDSAKLIGSLDDDIVLNQDAVEIMIDFWNTKEPETAGIGFNITNEEPFQPSLIKVLLGASSQKQGMVFKSGSSTPISNVPFSIQTNWLNGGATIWRKEILNEFPHHEINAKWAIFEDLIFSYPIGKQYPMYVCAEAKVIHDHVFTAVTDETVHRFRGRSNALWKLYFVRGNEDLSTTSYLRIAMLSSMGGCVFSLLIKRDQSQFEYNLGKIQGLFKGIKALLTNKELEKVLEEN